MAIGCYSGISLAEIVYHVLSCKGIADLLKNPSHDIIFFLT